MTDYNYPKIDVRIPFEPEGRLGFDYNRIMSETIHQWVLLLDHDLLMNTNPHWYHLCQSAIRMHPNAGMFTCKTNVPHKTMQHDSNSPQSNDSIGAHQEYAKLVFDKHQFSCSRILPKGNVSGFFMLISKDSWSKTGGFPAEGMFKEDWRFSQKLHQKNIPIYLIDGLYVYHMRKRQDSWIENVNGTKEIKAREVKK
jgi:GT2 family glycosyltransferase